MLDMLDQISPGRRLIPILGYLAQHPDPTIAAKAALLVSRRIRNPDWVKRHVNAKDPRIRANVVEGLWGADTSYVRPTYEDCLRDDNNRVVGNALVGMHLMGEHGLERRVISMAGDCRIPFRWTAAWVMGQVGKPENIPLLQKLMHDDAPGVRGAALRGLFAIRRMTTPKPAAQAAEEADSRVLMDVDEPAPQATPHKSLMLDGNSYRYRV